MARVFDLLRLGRVAEESIGRDRRRMGEPMVKSWKNRAGASTNTPIFSFVVEVRGQKKKTTSLSSNVNKQKARSIPNNTTNREIMKLFRYKTSIFFFLFFPPTIHFIIYKLRRFYRGGIVGTLDGYI